MTSMAAARTAGESDGTVLLPPEAVAYWVVPVSACSMRTASGATPSSSAISRRLSGRCISRSSDSSAPEMKFTSKASHPEARSRSSPADHPGTLRRGQAQKWKPNAEEIARFSAPHTAAQLARMLAAPLHWGSILAGKLIVSMVLALVSMGVIIVGTALFLGAFATPALAAGGGDVVGRHRAVAEVGRQREPVGDDRDEGDEFLVRLGAVGEVGDVRLGVGQMQPIGRALEEGDDRLGDAALAAHVEAVAGADLVEGAGEVVAEALLEAARTRSPR